MTNTDGLREISAVASRAVAATEDYGEGPRAFIEKRAAALAGQEAARALGSAGAPDPRVLRFDLPHQAASLMSIIYRLVPPRPVCKETPMSDNLDQQLGFAPVTTLLSHISGRAITIAIGYTTPYRWASPRAGPFTR